MFESTKNICNQMFIDSFKKKSIKNFYTFVSAINGVDNNLLHRERGKN